MDGVTIGAGREGGATYPPVRLCGVSSALSAAALHTHEDENARVAAGVLVSGHERTFEPAVETSSKQPFVRLDARGAVYSSTIKDTEARAHWNPL